MHPRRLFPALTMLALLVLGLVACGDAPPPVPGEDALAEVEEGMSMTEVMDRLPQGDLSDEGTVQGYQRHRYFVDGQNIEVVWLHVPGSGGQFADARSELNPVIFVGGVLDGWGWRHFDQRSGEWALPEPEPRDAS